MSFASATTGGRGRRRHSRSSSPQIERAVERLRQLILDGSLPARQRVAELKVVDRVGVSRTPLRLAMERLAHEGLLERRPGGGFAVREFTFREVQNAIELRGALEGLACRLAAESRAAEKLTALQSTLAAVDTLLAVPRDADFVFPEYVRLNEQFHLQLIDMADNPLVSRLLEQVISLPFASPSAFLVAQAAVPDAHRTLVIPQEQHRNIVEAISLGDTARAEALAREHARLALRNLDLAARDRHRFRQFPGGALVRFS